MDREQPPAARGEGVGGRRRGREDRRLGRERSGVGDDADGAGVGRRGVEPPRAALDGEAVERRRTAPEPGTQRGVAGAEPAIDDRVPIEPRRRRLAPEEPRRRRRIEARDRVGRLGEAGDRDEMAGDHQRELRAGVPRAQPAQGRQREQEVAQGAGEDHGHPFN